MKAFLLAAGAGTRLRPLTDSLPKCLVPINGVPLIDIWLANLMNAGVEEVLINLHHLAERVKEHIRSYRGKIRVELTFEQSLLGSAGTVKQNRGFVSKEENFFVLYADNLTDLNLSRMLRYHILGNTPLTIGAFRSPNPRECGILECNEAKTITSFVEKPQHPQSTLANAGVYVASGNIFDYIDDKVPCDFGYDVIPRLIGKAKVYLLDEFIMDIGTMEKYKLAQNAWKQKLLDAERKRNGD